MRKSTLDIDELPWQEEIPEPSIKLLSCYDGDRLSDRKRSSCPLSGVK